MHCRNCEYALWNLTTRECPECGTAFRPSEYEFVPQSVRFCCPHCDHPYYGTGEKGHIEPAAPRSDRRTDRLSDWLREGIRR